MQINNKNILYIGLAGVAIYLLYKQYKDGKNKASGGNQGGSNEGGGNDGGNDGGNNTTPNNQLRLQKMANELFDAFDGCGTDNDTVKSVLGQVKSESDFQDLIRTYGVKATTCGFSSTKGSLLKHLCDENNGGWFGVGSNVEELNQILQSKGVTTLISESC